MTHELLKIESLTKQVAQLKEAQSRSISLFKQLKTQVGTFYGEQIDEHTAALEGRRFDAKEWCMNDTNGEQGI